MTERDPDNLDRVLTGLLSKRRPVCRRHPERGADAQCPECESFACWKCMRFDPDAADAEALLCTDCRQIRLAAGRWSAARLLRLPAVYVVALTTLALVLFLKGVGNPPPSELARKDQGRAWHTQRAGRLWLAQAVRSRERTLYLRDAGKRQRARNWAYITLHALRQARECWRGEEPEQDLAVAEARMYGPAEAPADGMAQLTTMLEEMQPRNEHYLPCLLYRAELAWQAGEKKQALQDWETVLRLTADAGEAAAAGNQLDKLIDSLAGGLAKTAVILQVMKVSGTEMNDREAREYALAAIEKYGVEDRFDGNALRSAASDDVRNSSAEDHGAGTMQIKHFSDPD